jgi:prepilin-type processing-associated H-X9-DG protein
LWYQAAPLGELTPNTQNELRGPVATCPEDPGALRSYAMNVWGSSKIDPSFLPVGATTAPWSFVRHGRAAPSKLILVSEAWSWCGSASAGWLSPPVIGSLGSTPGRRFGGGGGISYVAGRFGIVQSELNFSRHRLFGRTRPQTTAIGRVVIGYADGHVMLRSNEDLVTSLGISTLDSMWSPTDLDSNR